MQGLRGREKESKRERGGHRGVNNVECCLCSPTAATVTYILVTETDHR